VHLTKQTHFAKDWCYVSRQGNHGLSEETDRNNTTHCGQHLMVHRYTLFRFYLAIMGSIKLIEINEVLEKNWNWLTSGFS
jgi:hypothetical protein